MAMTVTPPRSCLQNFGGTLVMLDGRQGGGAGDTGGYNQDSGADFGRSSPMQRPQGGDQGENDGPSFARDDMDDEVPFCCCFCCCESIAAGLR